MKQAITSLTPPSFRQRLKRLLDWLVRPTSVDEEDRRQEYILNVLLVSTLLLAALALVYTLIDFLTLGQDYFVRRVVPVCLALTVFGGLYWLTRLRFRRLAAYGFVSLVFGLGTYSLVTWGMSLPQGLLVYCLVIVMSGVLLGTRAAMVVLGIVATTLAMLAQLQTHGALAPNTDWMRNETGGLSDALIFSATMAAIAVVSWLSNREIEKSLHRARRSEQALARERDALEVTVAERTAELRRSQLEKVQELYRFAEYGRLSSELMHDLASPLTAVHLNLEALDSSERSALHKRALNSVRYLEDFIQTARKQLQRQEELRVFEVVDELDQAVALLTPRARQAQVELILDGGQAQLFGNTLKFHQIIVNLVSNAIDAYGDHATKGRRQVVLTVKPVKHEVVMTVTDWGKGIAPGDLAHVFEPFFTTKQSDRGTGIGLTIVKRLVEESFKGEITVTSTLVDGTCFRVTLPIPK